MSEYQYYDRFGMDDGRGWMGRLAPLRDELQRGDLRPLYLGWLAGVTAGEVSDEAVEPEVPPGLSQLSAAQQALVEFLEIDPDLVAAAALGSEAVTESNNDSGGGIDAWLMGRSADEMRAVLKLLLESKSQQAERQIKLRFLAWQKENAKNTTSSAKQRSVVELRALAAEAENHRLVCEAKERARQETASRKKRETHLKTLAADFERCWKAIEPHAERGTASAYDEAKCLISDLADAYALASRREDFDCALRLFMVSHGKRGALVRRLVEAGLWKK